METRCDKCGKYFNTECDEHLCDGCAGQMAREESETPKRISREDRERQMLILFADYIFGDHDADDKMFVDEWLQSDTFRSIPPAIDDLRERIEARILELEKTDSMCEFPVIEIHTEIRRLKNLLKP